MLIDFFMIEVFEEDTKKLNSSRKDIVYLSNVTQILKLLNDKSIKAYVAFMCFVLNYFNSFNALFQSKDLMIHKFFPSIERILKQIG